MINRIKCLMLFFFWTNFVQSQVIDSSQCNFPLASVTVQEVCAPMPMDTVFNGEWTTQCVTFKPPDNNIHLNYIFVIGICPPGTNYNALYITGFNATCDTVLFSCFINNANGWDCHLNLDTSRTYTICYTWKALCTQTAMCPVITYSVIPVTLTSFTAEDKYGGVALKWTTASEINNEAFYIQKDNDIIWYEKGHGTTSQANSYIFFDSEPRSCYYTLMQKDYNGIVINLKTIKYNNKYATEFCLYWDLIGVFHGSEYSQLKNGVYVRSCSGASDLIVK